MAIAILLFLGSALAIIAGLLGNHGHKHSATWARITVSNSVRFCKPDELDTQILQRLEP